MKYLTLFLCSFHCLFASSFMTEDFVKGKEISEGYNLPMALIFTGSDWSQPSKKILEGLGKAQCKEIVFVHVDFPELNVQSQAIIQQNHALKKEYCVHGFPTVVLLGSDSKEITRLEYPMLDAVDFIGCLTSIERRYVLLKQRFKKAQHVLSASELLSCFHEARDLGALYLTQEIMDFGALYQLSPELLLEKYMTLLGTGKTEEAEALRRVLIEEENQETQSRLALLDFQEHESIKPLEAFLETYGQDQGERFWKIHLVMSEFFLGNNQKAEALEHAQVSYRNAPQEDKAYISRLIAKMLH